jgi:hypothetical protein
VAWLVYREELVSSAYAYRQALDFWLMRARSAAVSTGHHTAVVSDELELETLRLICSA